MNEESLVYGVVMCFTLLNYLRLFAGILDMERFDIIKPCGVHG